jgi:hypothetical protein
MVRQDNHGQEEVLEEEISTDSNIDDVKEYDTDFDAANGCNVLPLPLQYGQDVSSASRSSSTSSTAIGTDSDSQNQSTLVV